MFIEARELLDLQGGQDGDFAHCSRIAYTSAASAIASRRSLLNVFIAWRARHKLTQSMVRAALEKALVALWPGLSTLAAPAVAGKGRVVHPEALWLMVVALIPPFSYRIAAQAVRGPVRLGGCLLQRPEADIT